MVRPLRNVQYARDMPKRCDICGEKDYGDYPWAITTPKKRGKTRIWKCGRHAHYFADLRLRHWSGWDGICQNATEVLERQLEVAEESAERQAKEQAMLKSLGEEQQ